MASLLLMLIKGSSRHSCINIFSLHFFSWKIQTSSTTDKPAPSRTPKTHLSTGTKARTTAPKYVSLTSLLEVILLVS